MPDAPQHAGCHDEIDAADYPELVAMPTGYGHDEWLAQQGPDQ